MLKVNLCLQEGFFNFQKNNIFYNNQSIKIKSFLGKNYPNLQISSSFEIHQQLPISHNDQLYIDIRINESNFTILKTSIDNMISLYSINHTPLLSFDNQTRVILKESLDNPYNIYKKLMQFKSYISPSANIMPGSHVIGNSYIGNNVVIGHNSLVRDSFIGDNSIIGYNTEINESYLGESVSTHTNFIGNSIVGDNCSFGFITCTSVIRLNRKNIDIKHDTKIYKTNSLKVGALIEVDCNIGSYVDIMPGILIGKSSMIRPFTLIKSSIKRNTFTKTIISNQEVSSRVRGNRVWNINKVLKNKLLKKVDNQ